MRNLQPPQGMYPQPPKTPGDFLFIISFAVVAILIVWFASSYS